MWKQFWFHFSGQDEYKTYPNPVAWYRKTLHIIPQLKLPILTLLVALLGGVAFGIYLGFEYQLPSQYQDQLSGDNLMANLATLQVFVGGALPVFIIVQNLRVILLQMILGVVTLGVMCILIFILPWILISYVATQFYLVGENPFTFLLATIVPHAIVELPALLLIAAAALRWDTVTIARPPNVTLGEIFLQRMAEYGGILIALGIPLLIVAALVESFITPQVVVWVYGG